MYDLESIYKKHLSSDIHNLLHNTTSRFLSFFFYYSGLNQYNWFVSDTYTAIVICLCILSVLQQFHTCIFALYKVVDFFDYNDVFTLNPVDADWYFDIR